MPLLKTKIQKTMSHLVIITTREFNGLFKDSDQKEINLLKDRHKMRKLKSDEEIINIASELDLTQQTLNAEFNAELNTKIGLYKEDCNKEDKKKTEEVLINFLKEKETELPDIFFSDVSTIENLNNESRFYNRKFICQIKRENKPKEIYGYRCFEERSDIINPKEVGEDKEIDFLTDLISDIASLKDVDIEKLFDSNIITLIVHKDDIGYKSKKDDLQQCLKKTNSEIIKYFDKKLCVNGENGNKKEVSKHNIYPYSHQAGLFLDIITSDKFIINSALDIHNIINKHQKIEEKFKNHEKEIFINLEFEDFNFNGLNSKLF